MIKHGANVNVLDRWNGSPLDDAIRNKQDAAQLVLVQNGALTGRPHLNVTHLVLLAERPGCH